MEAHPPQDLNLSEEGIYIFKFQHKKYSPQRSQRGKAAIQRNHPLPPLPPRGGGKGWGGFFLHKI
jgi:hypothetical protein